MTPPSDDTLPASASPAERAAWEQRIRLEERERVRSESLHTQFTELRSQAAHQHGEVMDRLTAVGTLVASLDGRVTELERDRRVREKAQADAEARFGFGDWSREEEAAVRPMTREWLDKKTGRGQWRERLAVAVGVTAVLAVLINLYLTLRGAK